MNKSKSFPHISEEKVYSLRKSSSLSDVSENSFIYEEEFEGDGLLGIKFGEVDGKVVVKSIDPGTVADESYDLKTQMIVTHINETSIDGERYSYVRNVVNSIWERESKVHLKFKKQIFEEISRVLNENDLLKYYDDFVELGAQRLSDLEFVEMGDLEKMRMNSTDIENFKRIRLNI
jgi:hypothetical protein